MCVRCVLRGKIDAGTGNGMSGFIVICVVSSAAAAVAGNQCNELRAIREHLRRRSNI